MIAHDTGTMSTVAGDAAGLLRPMGLAVARNGDLYIADTGHQRVLRIDGSTREITTMAAGLGAPMGLALVPRDGQMVLHVADALANRVHVIDPDGRMTTLGGPEPLVTPTRLAYHPAGWLYVKDGSPDGLTALALRGAGGE
jgi:DNA-binding beta-propeller fold protein YncE